MKAYSICITLFFSLIILLFSCKKDDLVTFEGKRFLYFSVGSTDSLSVDFSMLPDEVKDTVFKIPIALMGGSLDTSAPFDIVIDGQITTVLNGTDFVMPTQFSFPARKSSDTVSVKFIRNTKLRTGEYVLGLELKPPLELDNTLFDRNRARKIRIFLTDVLKPTAKWANTSDGLGTEYYLGRFTRKKIQLLASLKSNSSYLKVYADIDKNPKTYGILLNNYLKAQKAAGTPVEEDDGTLMTVGLFYK